MESFFVSLKVEEIYRFRYAGINDLAASLRSYITFYNNERPHISIGGMTPVEAQNQNFQQESAVEEIDRAPLARQSIMCGRLWNANRNSKKSATHHLISYLSLCVHKLLWRR